MDTSPTSKDNLFVELGIVPGADYQFYKSDSIKIDSTAREDTVDFSKRSITLSNKYKNDIVLNAAFHDAADKALNQIDSAMNRSTIDGAFKTAADTVTLVIAETVKYTLEQYPLDDKSLDIVVTYIKKSTENLRSFIATAYDHYRDESNKIAIEKSTRDQVMAAESIARASAVRSSTTTIDGGVKMFGSSYDRSYGPYSYGYSYGSGKIGGTATTTYATGMSHLKDDLETDAIASANIEAQDQIRASSNAAASVHDHCFAAMDEFFKTFEKLIIAAYPDTLAYPNGKYGDINYWVEIARDCTENDLADFASSAAYYDKSPKDIWELLIGEEIYSFLVEHKYDGVYKGPYLNLYLKAMGLSEFKPFRDLSEILATEIKASYQENLSLSKYDADSATELARLGGIVKNSIYLTDGDKQRLKLEMKDAGKAINKQRRYSIGVFIHWAFIVLGALVSLIFIAVPNIMLFQGIEAEVDWNYIWIVMIAAAIAGTSFFHKDFKNTFFGALLRGIGVGIGSFVLFFIVALVSVIATGRMEW